MVERLTPQPLRSLYDALSLAYTFRAVDETLDFLVEYLALVLRSSPIFAHAQLGTMQFDGLCRDQGIRLGTGIYMVLANFREGGIEAFLQAARDNVKPGVRREDLDDNVFVKKWLLDCATHAYVDREGALGRKLAEEIELADLDVDIAIEEDLAHDDEVYRTEREVAPEPDLEAVGSRFDVEDVCVVALRLEINGRCAICMFEFDEEEIEDGHTVVRPLDCAHPFHRDCLDGHINGAYFDQEYVTCSICRTEICPTRDVRQRRPE